MYRSNNGQMCYKSTKKFKIFKTFAKKNDIFAYMAGFLYLCSEFNAANMKRILLFAIGVIIIATALCLHACKVTRCTTTQAEVQIKGDSAYIVSTKTIETYDAHKVGQ